MHSDDAARHPGAYHILACRRSTVAITDTRSRPLVLAVNGSAASAAAARWASDLAIDLGSEVVVVHALPLGEQFVHDVVPVELKAWRKILERHLLGDWCQPLMECNVAHRVMIVERPPAAALIGIATRERASHIILGGREGGPRAEDRTSHLARHLAAHATCRIVSVPWAPAAVSP